jgi:hypothetical protein
MKSSKLTRQAVINPSKASRIGLVQAGELASYPWILIHETPSLGSINTIAYFLLQASRYCHSDKDRSACSESGVENCNHREETRP